MALRLRIREIAQVRVRYGYRKTRVLLKREGWNVGKKLVYRLYKEEGLALPRRNRRAALHRRERFRPTSHEVWSLDFVADPLAVSGLDNHGWIYPREPGHRGGTKAEGWKTW